VLLLVGATVRTNGVVVIPFCENGLTPSVQLIFQGPAPVSSTVKEVEDPTQMVCAPLRVAVGMGNTATEAIPDTPPAHTALTDVKE
jgi:hypothetical protein